MLITALNSLFLNGTLLSFLLPIHLTLPPQISEVIPNYPKLVATPKLLSGSAPQVLNSNTVSTLEPTPVVPTSQPTSIPTSTPLPVATATPRPTAIPTNTGVPRYAPTPTNNPVSVTSATTGGLFMEAINNYRRSQGLSDIRNDSYTCRFASTRASEITSSFSHDGFNNRVGGRTLPYPTYRAVVENLAQTSDAGSAVNLWINSPGHAANLRADISYGCVGNSGQYYAFEGWKP